jgi:tetratricopeptide (TPR) repeat protein
MPIRVKRRNTLKRFKEIRVMKQNSIGLQIFPVAVVITFLLVTAASASAQQQDAGSFLKVLNKAQEKSQAQNWAAAIPLWEQVVSINPNMARFWYALATAQMNAGENRKAISSLEKSLELGARSLWLIAYQLAQVHGLLREKDPTLKWLDRAIELGFRNREGIRNDQTFAFLKDDPRFKSLTAEIDASRMSRIEGWRHDLLFVETEVKRMHYQPFRQVSQAQFETELRRLREDVPRLTDNQIIVRLMRVMSLIGDGHTILFPEFIPEWRQTVPVQFELFQEGLFVIAADPKYAELVGAKVLRFGQQPAEQVIHVVGPIISRDNEQGVLRSIVTYVRYPQVLNALGLVPQSDRMELTVRDADGKTRTASIAAVEIDSDFNRIFGHPKWMTAYQVTPGPMPLYLKDRRTNYWFEYLTEKKIVYFQFNLVVNSTTEPLNAFVERLFKFVDEHDVEKLIIDMRWNNGGNALMLMPLINGLVRSGKINRNGHLFVLVGRYTFSAAIPAAALIERHTNAIFVGEPTPSGPNVIAESNIINLPYSRVRVSISDLFWQGSSPVDRRTWIAPLHFVPPSFEAYKAKRDPALELILNYPEGN